MVIKMDQKMVKMKDMLLVTYIVSKMGYLRAEMKELWMDGMMEVSMEKRKENLLARKNERAIDDSYSMLEKIQTIIRRHNSKILIEFVC